MEVKEATDFLEDIGYSVSGYGNTYISGDIGVKKGTAMTYFKKLKEISTLLKSLESENKVYRNEQSGWVKEIERRQAKIRELEKLDLNVRGLMLENKKLKKENKALRKDKWELEGINEACRRENEAYREMWKELKPTDDYECLILEERHLLSKMGNLENKYLGGGE